MRFVDRHMTTQLTVVKLVEQTLIGRILNSAGNHASMHHWRVRQLGAINATQNAPRQFRHFNHRRQQKFWFAESFVQIVALQLSRRAQRSLNTIRLFVVGHFLANFLRFWPKDRNLITQGQN